MDVFFSVKFFENVFLDDLRSDFFLLPFTHDVGKVCVGVKLFCLKSMDEVSGGPTSLTADWLLPASSEQTRPPLPPRRLR